MADIIKVTPEKLKTASASLETTGNNVKSVTGEMITLVTGIGKNVWSGEAFNAYANKFKSIDQDVVKMQKRLSQQSQHLSKIADSYRMTEDTNKGAPAKIKSLVFR